MVEVARQDPAAPSEQDVPRFDPRYVVERELGRGGMGRVFLARDLKLDRSVAIKALSPGEHDAQDLRRLELEARAAGSINHPNIVAVHDIGMYEGRPYIVSEYLRGMTLRTLLEAGPLPLIKAIDLSVQLAQGLVVAHERGVVHRDLKPENLFITEEGWLKILDFGIAKRTVVLQPPPPTTPSQGSPAAAATPPAAAAHQPEQLDEAAHAALTPFTSPGAILGTVGYMSPEQVLGKTADQRSDLFSFGVILYEMLAGTRAFSRPTPVATSFSILQHQPAPLPAAVPVALRDVVQRCLAKDPAQRFQTARELGQVLEGLRPTGEVTRVLPPRVHKRSLLLVAISLVVAAVAIAFALKVGPSAPLSFRQITFHPGAVWSARFAPDGSVVYAAAWDAQAPRLFRTHAGDPEARKLELPEASLLAVSPAGDLAVLLRPRFRRGEFSQGTFSIVPAGGGPPREIAEGADFADFAPDGSLAVIRAVNGRSTLQYPPGQPLLDSPGYLSNPRFSPDGKLLAFIDHLNPNDDEGSLQVIEAAGGKARMLAPGWGSIAGLAWSPDGSEVLFTGGGREKSSSQRALRAVTLGGRQRLLSQVGGDLELQDVSRDGRVLVTQPDRRLGVGVIGEPWQRGRDLSWFDRTFLNDLSSDGTTALLTVTGAAGGAGYTMYLRKVDGSSAVKLGDGYGGSLSPDGTRALGVDSRGAGPVVLYPTGPGQPVPVAVDGLSVSRARFFPDGRRILVAGQEAGHASRLYVKPLDGGPAKAISGDGLTGSWLAIAPDGNQVVAVDGSGQVIFIELDKGLSRPLTELAPGEAPFGFASDGALYVGRVPALPVQVDKYYPQSGKREHWRQVMADASGATVITKVLIVPNGKALAYNYGSVTTHLYLLAGLN